MTLLGSWALGMGGVWQWENPVLAYPGASERLIICFAFSNIAVQVQL